MLILKAKCETCEKPLPPDSDDARICSFECTFCEDCAANTHDGACSNCGGNFEKRAIRPAGALEKYPAATE